MYVVHIYELRIMQFACMAVCMHACSTYVVCMHECIMYAAYMYTMYVCIKTFHI